MNLTPRENLMRAAQLTRFKIGAMSPEERCEHQQRLREKLTMAALMVKEEAPPPPLSVHKDGAE